MCGRYVLKANLKDLQETYKATAKVSSEFQPVYNVAPTFDMPVILQPENKDRFISLYRWGLVPFWAKEINTGYSMINARSESLDKKKTYQQPFKTQRCIVPANGFYEWKKTPEGKIPHFITLSDKPLMSFAGLYEHWKGPDHQLVKSFTIITTEANKTIQPLHNRMPAILLPEEMDMWLDPVNQDTNALKDLLRPYPDDDIKFHPVSTDVNNPRNQDASLIEPEEPDQNLFS